MSRGLGRTQQAVLAVVDAHPDGLDIPAIVGHLHGDTPTRAQEESVRRAIRTLRHRDLVTVTARRVTAQRRSLKRIFDLSGCQPEFCSGCARRGRRVRLQDWHRRVMRDNARVDRGWLDDLAAAEASGYVHYAASDERLVSVEPAAVDTHHLWRQFVSPRNADERRTTPLR